MSWILVEDSFREIFEELFMIYLHTGAIFSEIQMEAFIYVFKTYLRERFMQVLKPHDLSGDRNQLNQTDLVAHFLDFLLQILYCEADTDEGKHRYAVLHKELKYLLAYLGDVPLRQTTDRELEEEVEMLANEAGSFIHTCVFSGCPVEDNWFYAERQALLEKVELLNAKIRQHCVEFSELPMNYSRPSNSMDSIFMISSLLVDLENRILNDHGRLNLDSGTKEQLVLLRDELNLSQAFLKGSSEVPKDSKEHLLLIGDMAYEAEYLIDSHATGNMPVWYLNLRLTDILRKLKLTRQRFPQLKKMDNKTASVGGGEGISVPQPYIETRGDNVLYSGFEDNMTLILNDLIRGAKTQQIISIYGMPGLGKTTMANMLYSCPSAYKHFDRRAWCAISQTYNKRALFAGILMCIADNPDEEKILKMDEAELGLEIHKTLVQRRYLIVLDDVWDSKVWYDLRIYCPDDGNGSRILITTRIKDTAPDCSIFHTLPFLTEDQCWELLEKKVFPKESCSSKLLTAVGKRIARKCHGIPLAVVVTAGILVNLEKNEDEWRNVEGQLDVLLLDEQRDYRRLFELSYEHLPHNIKPCFLYFAAFPEDQEIPVKKLVRLWISEGFIQKEEGRSSEEIAGMYLSDLINRSLVLVAKLGSDGGIKTCRIHDLLRDICIRKAHEDIFLKSVVHDSCLTASEKHQRLCVHKNSLNFWRPFGLHLRSVQGQISPCVSYFSEMAVLRVMDLLPIRPNFLEPLILELPINLRYLGFYMPIPREIVGNFINLEFLSLEYDDVIYIPPTILKLVKLRHLSLKQEAEFEEDCDSSEVNNLRSLSYVNVHKQKDEEILRSSPHLVQLKCICGGDRAFPVLGSLTKLESLKVLFKNVAGRTLSEITFPQTIRKLHLVGCALPWDSMSVIGRLLNLEVLKLGRDAFLGEVWETGDDEFQKLRFLRLELDNLRQWTVSCDDHFPVIECLVLSKCIELQEIPGELGNIPSLQRIEVRECGKKVCLSARQIGEQQNDYGNNLQIMIADSNWTKEELVWGEEER